MGQHRVIEASELQDGDRVIVDLEEREIAIFRCGDEWYAYTNWCPHQGGPICEGKLTGHQEASFDRTSLEVEYRWTKDEMVIACPWHDWTFDLTTGENIPESRIRLPSHEVWEEDGDLYVEI